MPTKKATKAYIFKGRLVRPGDKVKLIPPHWRKGNSKEITQDYRLLRQELGWGSFTVSWITKISLGHQTIFVDTPKVKEAAVKTSDLM